MDVNTVTKQFSNVEIKAMITNLQPILSQRNVIGYVAARNFRVLKDAISDYIEFEREAIVKYGTPDVDENNNPIGTTSISPDSEMFNSFLTEMTPIQNIKHVIPIMLVKFDDVIGQLSGEEILGIDWMLED